MSHATIRCIGALCLITAATGCTRSCGAPKPLAEDESARTFALDTLPFADLSVPPSSRPDDALPPEHIRLGPWRRAGTTWQAPMPVRLRTLFFFRPQGMSLLSSEGEPIPHAYGRKQEAPRWTYDADTIYVHGLDGDPDGIVFLHDKSTQREARLNYNAAGIPDPAEFVRYEAQSGPSARAGLLLPAPSSASWRLRIPPAAELRFGPGIVQPEVADAPPSDGAVISVSIRHGEDTSIVWSGRVQDDAFTPVTVALDPWADKDVELSVRTEPGRNKRFDYAFLADPVIASRKANPRRVILVFIDTLRADHLGTYGYARNTSPALDAFARQAAVFEEARSVAPWTLPSTMTALTGHEPEVFGLVPTLQGRLRAQGFATAMLAGNYYLSAVFGLHTDWGLHHVLLLPDATSQVDRALAWLDEHDGRDALLLLHLMDPHLPYDEPARYRGMFAKDKPASAPDDPLHRATILRNRPDADTRRYIEDRYDQNIRYTDDQLARLFASLRPSDVVVVFSDHGEEFWDHGEFEHGHALYDEVLRVPFIVRAPGVRAQRIAEPVSLLDLTPTVLDLLGMPDPDARGLSLVPAMQGDASATETLAKRYLAFGRPLYGKERWGVLHDRMKYHTVEGQEELYNLAEDPGEEQDLVRHQDADTSPSREALGEALTRDVVHALRVTIAMSRHVGDYPIEARVHVPGGIKRAWVGADPTEQSDAELVYNGGDTALIRWPAHLRGGRDVWILPEASLNESAEAIDICVGEGDVMRHLPPSRARSSRMERTGVTLARERLDRRIVELGHGITPLPLEFGKNVSGMDDELREELAAMGYLDDASMPDAQAAAPTDFSISWDTPCEASPRTGPTKKR